ncbi:MAG: tRNA (adenosine(37)-N6)-threonylcarbamoyltransferase complex ATPase subunit type 1 TsaE [Candidatus Doudnabacteria bacterium]|nr:tRNA (adenosine(37)-N6)-threonylcarbamoyltransferase complex ATPase subunit type 1 TsaE [Candidatus Doudnabacteria bacterium]
MGPLGAGKTTFVQALGRALGIGNAKSPTFTIVHCYNGRKKSLYHIDLYRLESNRELDAIGLNEILSAEENIVAIEWVDKFPKLMKKCDFLIELKITKNNKRNVTVTHN